MLKLLTIADLHWHSGLEYALQATSLLQAGQVKLHYRIIGTGDFLEAIVWARHELRLDSLVELLSPSLNQYTIHLDWVQIILLPSVFPHPLSHLTEITERRIPLILSDFDTWRAQIPIDYPVRWIPKRDPQALCNAIQSYF